MRKIIVLNRSEARKNSYSDYKTPRIIISISDAFGNPNNFKQGNPSIKGIARLYFNDVDGNTSGAMTKEHACRIAGFVSGFNDDVEIIVHCNAGISRSAGIAAALEYYYNGSDKNIFDNPKYLPNMLCYRLMLNALTDTSQK